MTENITHRTLQRQLRKAGLSCETPPSDLASWKEFLSKVQQSYDQNDGERYTLERSIKVSSTEMAELYESLRRSSESLLAQERDRFRGVISALGEGLFVLDDTGMITYANPEASRILSFSSDDFLGTHFEELVGFDAKTPASSFEVCHSDQAESSDNVTVEAEFLTKYGTRIPVQYTIRSIGRTVTGISGFVLAFRDIGRQKEFESAMASARDAALEASQLKSDFLATMSHEIRTPLNGIISLVELLRESDLNEQDRTDVETIRSCAFSLRSVISDVLDFSKIEAGKLFIDAAPFELRKTLHHLVSQMEAQMAEKSIVFYLYVEESIPERVIGDSLRLLQVLTNLLSNAIKFTPEQGAVICYVSLNSLTEYQCNLTFSVADSGIGIPKNKQETIFEAFTQADGSTTRNYGGTGLGLTISARLVEMMQGDIGVKSIPNIGSVFSVHQPLQLDLTQAKTSTKLALIPTPIQETIEDNAKAPRILLVEDNQVNQGTITRNLERQGYQVSLAKNGEEALQVAGEEAFDLILMDLHMPKMGGIEATRQLRSSDGQNRSVPIIALTADAISGVKKKCLEAGMSAYITKPIDYDELFKTIIANLEPA